MGPPPDQRCSPRGKRSLTVPTRTSGRWQRKASTWPDGGLASPAGRRPDHPGPSGCAAGASPIVMVTALLRVVVHSTAERQRRCMQVGTRVGALSPPLPTSQDGVGRAGDSLSVVEGRMMLANPKAFKNQRPQQARNLGAEMALVLPGPPAGSTSSAHASAQTCLGRSTAGPGGGPGPWRMRGRLRERRGPMPVLLRDTETAAACSPRACLSPWRSLTRRRDRRGARNQVPAAKGLVESDPRTLQLCVLGQVTTPFCASVLSSIK